MSRFKFISRRKSDGTHEEKSPFMRTTSAEKSNEKTNPSGSFFPGVQTKLEISKPGDRSERQADNMANAVVNATGPVQAKAGDETPQAIHKAEEEKKVAKKEEDKVKKKSEIHLKEDDKMHKKGEDEKVKKKEEDKKVQKQDDEKKLGNAEVHRKAEENSGKDFHNRLESAKSGGFEIPDKVRKDMEARFNLQFGYIKIHTDDEAIALCQEISAQAFTNGNHIFFNMGKYDPESSKGKHLLAHELTHVIQQMR